MSWKRFLAIACSTLALVDAFAQSIEAGTPIVIFARHAERADESGNDQGLSAIGAARANALAAALRDAGVSRILTTQYKRTRETAQPLATAAGIKPEAMTIERGKVDEHIAAVARTVREQKGGAILIVGHSNTITKMMTALGAPKMANLCEGTFSRLYVMSFEKGQARLVQSRFGAPEPELGADCKEPGKEPAKEVKP